VTASWDLREGHVLDQLRELDDCSVQCCITSPPYYGLRDYDVPPSLWGDGWEGCLGHEDTPDQFVVHLVEVFAEVRRVLRDDGTLWLNLGDSYAAQGGRHDGRKDNQRGVGAKRAHLAGAADSGHRRPPSGIKPKDLMGVPWMTAFALRADGWFLRMDDIWFKPNPMPESVRDRTTRAHEYLFMLAKSGTPRYWTHRDGRGTRSAPEPDYRYVDRVTDVETAELPQNFVERLEDGRRRWRRVSLWEGHDYYYDSEAVKEPDKGLDHGRAPHMGASLEPSGGLHSPHRGLRTGDGRNGQGANKRSVWTVATIPYPDAHFATFPPRLIEPMVLAGSAGQACEDCGAPWERVVERSPMEVREGPSREQRRAASSGAEARRATNGTMTKAATSVTTGWQPTCGHGDGAARSTVLDPFAGSGTTMQAAVSLGRDAVGIELSAKYAEQARRRMAGVTPSLFAL
jgi:DNA modification methylase